MENVAREMVTSVALTEQETQIREGVQALLEMGAYAPAIVAEVTRQSGLMPNGESPRDLMQRAITVLHLLGVAVETDEIPAQQIIDATILTTGLLRQIETAMGWAR